MTPVRDLPDILPLFPLPGALLLPRVRLPLHIFEPRYLAMLDEAMKSGHRLIGLIQPRPAVAADAVPPLAAVGGAGRLTAFTETDDGRYVITLTGISRFRLAGEVEGFAPYRRAKVLWQEFEADRHGRETDPSLDRPAFLDLLGRYFAAEQMATDWSSLREAEAELLINALAMLCPFGPEDKQALLEAPSLKARRETLVTLMEFALLSGGEEVMQ